MEPPLDAKPLDQAVDAKPGRNNADRAEKRGLLGIDFVAGQREPIAARGGDILRKGEDRDRLLLGELAGAAAWLAKESAVRHCRGPMTPSRRNTATVGGGLRNRSIGRNFRSSRGFITPATWGLFRPRCSASTESGLRR